MIKSNLIELFYSLKGEKEKYLCSQKGKEFEERILNKLNGLGYNRIRQDELDKDKFKELKKSILDKENVQIINNFFDYKKQFIYQPYGSQQYPDFIILENKKVLGIETKYSSDKGKPVWNSGLPRPNGIYIFGSYHKEDITYFLGKDIVSLKEVKKLQDFFDKELKSYQERFNEDEMKNQKYGFAAYIRKAFDQKATYNKNAILDFFSNTNRIEIENNVENFLNNLH